MWTIIEANIGIICACLPMCREPISIFFPTLLSSRTRIDADFSHAGSGKNDWSPPTHKSQGLRMASINISSIDNNSEEHILRDDKVEERDLDNEIRNITRFQVDYDVDDAYNDRSCYREEVRASGTLNGFQRHFIKLTSSAWVCTLRLKRQAWSSFWFCHMLQRREVHEDIISWVDGWLLCVHSALLSFTPNIPQERATKRADKRRARQGRYVRTGPCFIRPRTSSHEALWHERSVTDHNRVNRRVQNHASLPSGVHRLS